VIVTCTNDEEFGRVYDNGEKAEKFASRQKRSPVVKRLRIDEIDEFSVSEPTEKATLLPTGIISADLEPGY
jgi:hypothetical protein